MDEGTFFAVIFFPTPWPPIREIDVMAKAPIFIRAYPDGHLQITVEQPNPAQTLAYDTQRIAASSHSRALLDFTWSKGQMDVRLNGQPLAPLAATETPFSLPTPPPVLPESAPGHADALSRCRRWMRWRHQQFSGARAASRGRRMKTLVEQRKELEEAISTLRHLLAEIRGGKTFLTGSLAAILRSLVYWSEHGRYDPLLLRLAAAGDLPLPVFAFPPWHRPPLLVEQANYHLTPIVATLSRAFTSQDHMDLQEALANKVQIDRTQPPMGGPTIVDQVTAKDLIAQSANMLGAAHFDPDVRLALDQLRATSMWELDVLSRFLLNVGEVVLGLGEFVLEGIPTGSS